ncbi:fructuronate reductase [Arthrobacter sp. JUb119]|uniref:mannitol dehydrogenase family protein n=1 Tax=Arthrobacter sp. JUb115 TaxID=2485108 RepID=UPI00105C5025|nr:mannitol dehydrogenase family protein [Arthrobacter sp. JUb115]MCS3494523.1 fructuronate reductase [Arthrobacter sp. JUb119]TDU22613.1 fructuronate reductase [Arthrobacter sp. JUb115]
MTDHVERRPRNFGPGIIHLGLGNFHRAHMATYTRAAIDAHGGDWGIIGVASRTAAVVDAMKKQDFCYTVAQISPDDYSYSVPNVHTDALVAANEGERLLELIADPRIKIVSLTVTENGYTFDPVTRRLNLADARVQQDLDGHELPVTPIGQIALGLERRMLAGNGPVTILSCDNLSHNGALTKTLVADFIAELPQGRGVSLALWIQRNVTFPSTMVDRIVPSTTQELIDQVTSATGYTDAVPVPAEPFSMWIIEDNFAAGRPQWEAGGAIFSDEVDKFEQLKVRLLNGTHSLLAYLGALSGAATIPESVSDPWIADAARKVLREEYLPSVQVPQGVDVRAYEAELFGRWRNVALGHRTSQVGSDGSVKLRERVPFPSQQLRENGQSRELLALTVSGYLSCVSPLPGFDPGEHARAMQDPLREVLRERTAAASNGTELAHIALAELRFLGDDVAEDQEFIARVGRYVDLLHSSGPREALSEAMNTTEWKRA